MELGLYDRSELPTTEVVGFYPYGRLFSYLTSLIQRLQPLML